jgi:hypothetical protein
LPEITHTLELFGVYVLAHLLLSILVRSGGDAIRLDA